MDQILKGIGYMLTQWLSISTITLQPQKDNHVIGIEKDKDQVDEWCSSEEQTIKD